MTPAQVPVTTEDKCDRRWSFTRLAFSGVGVALAASVALLLFSLAESRYAMKVGHAAEAATGKVASDLDKHVDVQIEHDKHIGMTLGRIESRMDEILKAIVGE